MLPKVLHPVAGRPMVLAVLDAAKALSPAHTIVVIGAGMDQLENTIHSANPEAQFVIQNQPLGTGDAVKRAMTLLEGFTGDVVILYADTPLIQTSTLQQLLARLRENDNPALVALGFHAANPAEYGRMVTGENNTLEEIVEFREANEAQAAITLCNSGVMAVKGVVLPNVLSELRDNNSKKEYYLTDIVRIARKNRAICAYVEVWEQEVLGVNSRAELAKVELIMQQRLRVTAMNNGVTLIDPKTVTLCYDTKLGMDVTIHPHVVFGPAVRVYDNVTIKSFCHIEGAVIESGVVFGPFARLRPESIIHKNVQVGNFIEIKNSHLHEGSKVLHLSYIGDTIVGRQSNIGAGTITCNFDGFKKSNTTIGENVFVGSNSSLVAPVIIGDGAIIGAGSVITEDVPADALAIARTKQVTMAAKGKAIRKKKESW